MSTNLNRTAKKSLAIGIVLSTVISINPCCAQDGMEGQLNTINSYLAGLAIKNGYIAPNSSFHKVYAGKPSASLSEAVNAIHSLPKDFQRFSEKTHIATPTPEEMQFVTDDPIAFDHPSNMLLTGGGIDFDVATDETPTGLHTFDILTEDNVDLPPELIDDLANSYSNDFENVIGDVSTETQTTYNNPALHSPLLPWKPEGLASVLEETSSVSSEIRSAAILQAFPDSVNAVTANDAVLKGDLSELDSFSARNSSLFNRALSHDDTENGAKRFMLKGFVEIAEGTPIQSTCTVYAGPQAEWSQQGALVRLTNGAAFFGARRDTTIEAGLVDVHCTSGALVSVETSNGSSRVRACSGPGHVSVTYGAQLIKLNPGEEAWVVERTVSKREAIPADKIGRRHIAFHNVGDGKTLVMSEFSIPSLLAAAQYIPQDAKLLKTAAALHIVMRKHGKFYTHTAFRTPHKAFDALN